jgi:antitoxin VapB
METKRAKIFRNGASQAVRLPREFRFDADEVYIWRDDDTGAVVLSDKPQRSWASFVALRDELAGEELARYMTGRAQPPAQQRAPLRDEDLA